MQDMKKLHERFDLIEGDMVGPGSLVIATHRNIELPELPPVFAN